MFYGADSYSVGVILFQSLTGFSLAELLMRLVGSNGSDSVEAQMKVQSHKLMKEAFSKVNTDP